MHQLHQQQAFILGDETRSVPREIFPLPSFFPRSKPLKLEAGRKSVRRAEKAYHREIMVEECIQSLNALYSGQKIVAAPQTPQRSLSQQTVLDHINNSVHLLGPPPSDLSGSEALRMLRAFDGYGENQTPCNVKPYRPELLSLPSAGNEAVPLEVLIGEDGGEIVGEFCRSRLRSVDEARVALVKAGVKQAYCDPLLRDPRIYGQFVHRLVEADLVELVDEPPTEMVEAFFVGKKDGRLRMVIDCRRSNCWFREPDRTRLCTAEALSRIELDEGSVLHVSTADLKDAFYHFQLPGSLRRFFGMRPLIINSENGVAWGSKKGRRVYPRLKVLPMGWSHALFWCQSIHQRIVAEAGADIDSCLEDKSIVPDGSCMHLEYVDNFVVLGTDQARVEELSERGVKALRSKGLVVHEEESSTDRIKVLGWEFHGTRLRPLSHRVWRVRLALEHLCRIGRISGKQLEKVAGHASFISLGRRESLSCFGETYTFIQRHYWVTAPIWPSVRRELLIFSGILPLIWRDLSQSWSSEVVATDASEWGLGATTADFDIREVRQLGKFSERWRFDIEAFKKPRASTLGLDIVQGSDMADITAWASDPPTQDSLSPLLVHKGKPEEHRFQPLDIGTVDKPWRVVGRYKWKRIESIPVLEGRAALFAVKHKLRDSSNFHKRHLILSDSISAICALDRGRGRSFKMRRISQQVGALCLASGCTFHYRWLPSEWNPSDAPSRGSKFPTPRSSIFMHGDPSSDPNRVQAESIGHQEAKDGSEAEENQSYRHDIDCREKGADSRSKAKAGTSRFVGSCLGGDSVSDEVSAMLGAFPRGDGHESDKEIDSTTGGSVSVNHAGINVHGGRRPQSGQLHDGGGVVQPPMDEVYQEIQLASHQPDTQRLGQVGTTKKQASATVGSSMRHSDLLQGEWKNPGGFDDASWVSSIPTTGRTTKAESARPSASDSGGLQRPQQVEHHPAPFGTRTGIQDSGVRRDSFLRPQRVRFHSGGSSWMDEAESTSKGREDFHEDNGPPSRSHGRGVTSSPSGETGTMPSVPAEARGSITGLSDKSPQPGGDSEKRSVEEFQEPQKIRKRGKGRPNVTKPTSADLKPSRGGRKAHKNNNAVPALSPSKTLVVSVFLEIFSGSGRLGKKVAQVTGWPTLLWDIELGQQYDLLVFSNRVKIRQWMKAGWIRGFHLGTPCESFTRARDIPPGPPPLRSDQQPLGLSGLKPHDQTKVVVGNIFMRWSAGLLALACMLNIPGTLENPQRSRLWLCPPIQQIVRRRVSQLAVTHYCGWGMPWKKPTAFLAVHVNIARIETAQCKCSKRGICGYSGKPHVQLRVKILLANG